MTGRRLDALRGVGDLTFGGWRDTWILGKVVSGEIRFSGLPGVRSRGATPTRPDPRTPPVGRSADRHRQLQRAKRIPHWGNLALALGRAGPLKGRQHNAIQSNAQPRATQQSGPTQHAVNPTRRAARSGSARASIDMSVWRGPCNNARAQISRQADPSPGSLRKRKGNADKSTTAHKARQGYGRHDRNVAVSHYGRRDNARLLESGRQRLAIAAAHSLQASADGH